MTIGSLASASTCSAQASSSRLWPSNWCTQQLRGKKALRTRSYFSKPVYLARATPSSWVQQALRLLRDAQHGTISYDQVVPAQGAAALL